MKKMIKSRQELYSMVWKEPLSSIVKKYQITYVELRKVLLEMCIPIPENGYWSKLRFGKQVEFKALPEDYSGRSEVELLEKELCDVETENKINNPSGKIQKDRNDELFKVPDKLSKPDILIVNTKEYIDAGSSFYWRHNHRFPERNDVLDVDTTRTTFPRALRIMDTLIKILRNRGHEIGIKYGKTNAIVYGQEIEIKLREKYRVVDEPREKYSSRNLEPTGILSFIIEPGHYHQKTINDGQDLLETKLETIITKLEALGELKREEHIKNEEWHRQWQEQQRIEREKQEKKAKELSDFKSIFHRAIRLHQSNIMRNYISKVEETSVIKEQVTDELRDWLLWAKKKIDWYDPLKNSEDETFDEDDKGKIFSDLLKEWL